MKRPRTSLGICSAAADRGYRFQRRHSPGYNEEGEAPVPGRLPEFEKAGRFKMNIVNCALLGALVLSMPERPDVERLTTFTNTRTAAAMKGGLPGAVSAH